MKLSPVRQLSAHANRSCATTTAIAKSRLITLSSESAPSPAPGHTRPRQHRSPTRAFRPQRIRGKRPVKTGPYPSWLQARVSNHAIPSQSIRILDGGVWLRTHGARSRSGPGTGRTPTAMQHQSIAASAVDSSTTNLQHTAAASRSSIARAHEVSTLSSRHEDDRL